MRFLAVLVVATPCPLLIAIPVAIIGAISLAAKRSIIIRDPAVLERIDGCRTIILDKTGTLTYGAADPDRSLHRRRHRTMSWCCSWPPAWSDTRSIRWPDRSSMRRAGASDRARRHAKFASDPAKDWRARSTAATCASSAAARRRRPDTPHPCRQYQRAWNA